VPITDAACTRPEVGCRSGSELVAGGEGPDSCRGDSGGPLYLHTPWGPLLAGLTSRGVSGDEGSCGQCGPNHAPTVSVPPLEVGAGSRGQVRLAVLDEDVGDLHRFELAGPPAHGEAWVEADGTLHYLPRDGFTGEDRVGVRVTDDGVPALSTRVELLLSVRPASAPPPREPEPGCSAAGGGPRVSLALLALLAASARAYALSSRFSAAVMRAWARRRAWSWRTKKRSGRAVFRSSSPPGVGLASRGSAAMRWAAARATS